MRVLGVIPVRYNSTRFPGKALADIHGLSMVQRVYLQASQTPTLTKVLVATDHHKIFQHVRDFGGNVCMTDDLHPSGTDRCWEALQQDDSEYDYIVNIQGDEPFILPEQIEDLTKSLNKGTEIATLAKLITDKSVLSNPNEVKVLIDAKGKAIYFSRAPLPYQRDKAFDQWLNQYDYYRHIGIYAYRRDVLEMITKLPVSGLEKAEGLEQLRWLENGYSIKVFSTEFETKGIDTPEDLEKALKSDPP